MDQVNEYLKKNYCVEPHSDVVNQLIEKHGGIVNYA